MSKAQELRLVPRFFAFASACCGRLLPRGRCGGLVLWCLAVGWMLPLTAAAGTPDVRQAAADSRQAEYRAMVEADWLRQAVVRQAHGELQVEDDARGGCDGVIDGRWGFHTAMEDDPWWQVDLGEKTAIERIRVFNRCDETASRIASLSIATSDDGRRWETIYEHDGSVFFGHSDGAPLEVSPEDVSARYVRLQLAGHVYFHLDEVEIFARRGGELINVARGRRATQSSLSQWSKRHGPSGEETSYPIARSLRRAELLLGHLERLGCDVSADRRELARFQKRAQDPGGEPERAKRFYLELQWFIRRLAFSNPLVGFDSVLFVKRHPPAYSHMSDQYYGWWAQPDGGLYVLEDIHSGAPRERCLTSELPSGTVIRPELSYDGRRALFAFARYYPGLHDEPNKMDKSNVPEDAFFHLYEVNIDGTGLRRLTFGKYDDFDGRYLPNGDIAFLSTRRGRYTQMGADSTQQCQTPAAPDSYVRCGGGLSRPVALYTLHRMNPDGSDIRPISAFESFEWTPSIDHQGQIIFARWDYVDRHNQSYISLWAARPDGSNVRAIYGNMTRRPIAVFEARAVPNSDKLVFTGSAHHSITAGTLALLDVDRGVDGAAPLELLTPDVPFPEVDGWPSQYYANPYPLSETDYLVAWSDEPLGREGQVIKATTGIYLYDRFGNLNLLKREAEIGCQNPIPLRPRTKPPVLAPVGDPSAFPGEQGQMLLIDVNRGLPTSLHGKVDRLRLIGIPVKTQPQMNHPPIGLTTEDPGKFVLGTVPVEGDGSAHFRVPSGVPFFMQALDGNGQAVQTMRSAVYLQPGESLTCVGCHEPRNTAPPRKLPLAAVREPSALRPDPPGSWPFDFAELVQPVLDRQCAGCHQAGKEGAELDLTPPHAYNSLVDYGEPSLRERVLSDFHTGRSTPGSVGARNHPLWRLLEAGHYGVQLTEQQRYALSVWMDTYAQRSGAFSEEQEEELRRLRVKWAALLTEEHP